MDKKEALLSAMQQIEKQFGKGSIMRLGETNVKHSMEVVSTGILPLDIATGIGKLFGLPYTVALDEKTIFLIASSFIISSKFKVDIKLFS